MATYIDRDLGITFNGDLILDGRGDIKLHDALETHKSAANFVLRTDYGDYAPDVNVGCNLGSFIGETNSERVHAEMENLINRAIRNQIFNRSDAVATVVPFDHEEALCIVEIEGTFLVSGELIQVENQKIAYTFPYIAGEPTPLTIP